MKKTNRTATRNPPAEERETAIGVGTAALIYSLLSVIYFFPAFLPENHIFGTDYLAGGYFFYDFVSQRLADGELPKWVPYIYGGLPLSANPGSTFYPVRLIADLLFPTTWILPFIFVVQFAVAGLGAYLLARELGCRPWIAFLTGLAFQFTGITISSVYAGHDGRVIVATFAPLFFFFLRRGIRTGRFSAFVGAAATLGFSLLSFQIQNNYYLLLGGAGWAVFSLFDLGVVRDRRGLTRTLLLGVAAVAFGFVIAAVNFLPFLDYVPQSPRGAEGGRGYEYSISFSMPPEELLSVAVPEEAGILENYLGRNPFKLHTEYVGAFVLVLAVLGFRAVRARRLLWFFVGLGAFALSIAFGGYTPLYRLYYEILPGTARFRAPSLSFFLFALALTIVAGLALEGLASRRAETAATASKTGSDTSAGWVTRWLLILAAVAAGAALFAGAAAGETPRDTAAGFGYARFAFFVALVTGGLWLWWSGRLRSTGVLVLLSVVTVSDLWLVGRNFFETVPPPAATFAPDDVVYFLAGQERPARVWVLPVPPEGVYRGHGNYLMLHGIEQAGGEHGNQLQRYNEFAGAGRDVYVDWHNFLSDANFLSAANIRYIVSMVPLETPLLREVHRGSALVYENSSALPRAHLVGRWIATSDTTAALELLADPAFDVSTTAVVYGGAPAAPDEGAALEGTAEILEATPDRVVVRATTNRGALLVLADNYFPGWRATIDGEEVPIVRANHTFRGVFLDAGTSVVAFEYRPRDLYLGFYIYLASLALLAAYGGWMIWTRRRVRPTPS